MSSTHFKPPKNASSRSRLSIGLLLLWTALCGAESREAAWIPARWHSHDPATLELLRAGPVNCILLERDDWHETMVRAARKQGLAVLGVIRPGETAAITSRLAAQLGMNGVVLEGDFEQQALDSIRAITQKLAVIELPSRARIRLDSRDPITGTNQGLWPGLEIEHNGKTIVGPTSAPWINTNGGFLRFLVARTGRTTWLAVDPPPGNVFPVERYLQAIGDAAIPGARWVISIDSDFEARLLRRENGAVKDWRRIADHLRFYEQWRQASAFGTFGVIIDRKTGGLLSSFLLDMLAAQRTSALVIPPGRVEAGSLKRLSVLLDLEKDALNTEERRAVQEFVDDGGAVLNPPATARFPEPSPAKMIPERRDLDRLQSLWEMVYNATLRKNFGVRAFNTTGILTAVVTPDNGRSVIVHLLNYTDYPSETITVHALGNWKRARLYRPDAPPRELTVYKVAEGTATDVDAFTTSAAIHFE